MRKDKLTPWFPGDVKPVRKGVYERDWLNEGPYWFSYWNGKHWCLGNATPGDAARAEHTGHIALYQHFPWRGLAQDPKAKP